MSNFETTNFRNVFKSDHLGVIDLDEMAGSGSNLIFTIDYVTQHKSIKVAGKSIPANIAHFKENIKDWVINAGNSAILHKLSGSIYTKDWNNLTVELYVNRDAKLKGEVVGGIRVSPRRVILAKKIITKETAKMWDNAKKSYKENGNFNAVLKRADVSPENQELMIQEINDNV